MGPEKVENVDSLTSKKAKTINLLLVNSFRSTFLVIKWVRRHIPSCSWAIFVDFCARIRMGPEKVENIDSLTFKKAKNHKFAVCKLISQYGFGHKMG